MQNVKIFHFNYVKITIEEFYRCYIFIVLTNL